jgi:hypothetical protein
MVDNQHRRIAGYRDLDNATIGLVNTVKMCEAGVADLWREIAGQDEIHSEDLKQARRLIRTGFMLMVRSITQPTDPWDGDTPRALEDDRG